MEFLLLNDFTNHIPPLGLDLAVLGHKFTEVTDYMKLSDTPALGEDGILAEIT